MLATDQVVITNSAISALNLVFTTLAGADPPELGDSVFADFNGDRAVNLFDFFLFADAFGGADPKFDLTGDGKVNLSDFFLFADAFGST